MLAVLLLGASLSMALSERTEVEHTEDEYAEVECTEDEDLQLNEPKTLKKKMWPKSQADEALRSKNPKFLKSEGRCISHIVPCFIKPSTKPTLALLFGTSTSSTKSGSSTQRGK